MKTLRIAAQMQPVVRRADGSVTLKLVSAQEVETALFAEIDGYRQVNGHLLFSPDEIADDEVPTDNAVAESEAEPGSNKWLNKVTFAYYMQRYDGKGDFHLFKRRVYQKFGQQLLDKLD